MKSIVSLLACGIFLLSVQSTASQVQVSGTIPFSTTWAKSLSPYYVVGDVQVPSGVTLTIEPGVQLVYGGSYELLVKGQLSAIGTVSDSIVFRSDVKGVRKGKRFLNFEGSNLANQQLSYISMSDGNIGIQVGDETEFEQKDKNSGTLNASHLSFNNTNILTSGYQTNALVQLNGGRFVGGQIMGDYPSSEKITLKDFTIQDAELFSDSYNRGIWLERCEVKNTTFRIGCCDANFNIKSSTIEGGRFNPYNTYYRVTLTNSRVSNMDLNMSEAASVTITNSIITLGANQQLQCKNLTMAGSSVIGSGKGKGLTLFGQNSIQTSTISGFGTALTNEANSELAITTSNLSNNSEYHMVNNATSNIQATDNWWGTTDVLKIGSLLWDVDDDIAVGDIVFTGQLSNPNTSAPITPPMNVVRFDKDGAVIVSWTLNKETDLKGYKIYKGSADSKSFTYVKTLGKVTRDTLTGVSMGDVIYVTACDLSVDGTNDQTEGHESWYAKAGTDVARIYLSSSKINMGLVRVDSTATRILAITNNGTSDLIVSNVVSSNNKFTVGSTSFVVKPDSTYNLVVNFKPTALGQVEGLITLYHNSLEQTNVVQVNGIGSDATGTVISGIITANQVLAKSLSPYYVVGDVQVPSGVTLTIEPGVQLVYGGSYELLVKGQLSAIGTVSDSIVFRSDVKGVRKGKRFLNFEGSNLANQQLSYISMSDGNIGIQVGDETEFEQKDKNSGTLNASHLSFNNTNILTSGYQTNALVQLNGGRFVGGQIMGDYPSSEKITLKDFTIQDAELFSDSYNRGIWLERCEVKNTTFRIGCCDANFNIKSSTIEGGRFNPYNTYYRVTLTNSRVSNMDLNMSEAASVTITNSIITLGANQQLQCKNLTMAGSSVIGSGKGKGLTLFGQNSIQTSTISGFGTALTNEANSELAITTSNLSNNSEYHMVNNATSNIQATNNWWGTTDVLFIKDKIEDYDDDIKRGSVIFSPLYMTKDSGSNYLPVVTNTINPLLGEAPLYVSFTTSANDPDGFISEYKWDFNGDKNYDFSSSYFSDTIVTFTKGGRYLVESCVTDDRNLSNRSLYKIAVIDFKSQSKLLDENEVLVNWGWGNYHTVAIDAAALSFLNDGDVITIFDYDGYSSTDCGCSNTRNKVLVASQTFSAGNDSVFVFNCQPSYNLCDFNGTMRPGFAAGNLLRIEATTNLGKFELIPASSTKGSLVFADSAFTSISEFEVKSMASDSSQKMGPQRVKSVANNQSYYTIYKNGVLYKQHVTDLYFVDKDVTPNITYKYDIYLVRNGEQLLSNTTSVVNTYVKIKDIDDNSSFELYPNPAKDVLNIITQDATIGRIIIYDSFAKEVINQTISGRHTIVNISYLTKGIYLIKYLTNNRVEVKKVIKD